MKKVLLSLMMLLAFTVGAFAQNPPPMEGEPGDDGNPPVGCSSADYTQITTYEFAQSHSHAVLISVDGAYQGRTFVAPGNGGDMFLGNVIYVETLDGCNLALWCPFSSDTNYWMPIIAEMGDNPNITVQYDPECGLVTAITFR